MILTEEVKVACMHLAWAVAHQSKCTRLNVGCVVGHVTRAGFLIQGAASNSPPGSVACTGEPGKCGCVHSEEAAFSTHVWFSHPVVFVTHAPCARCVDWLLKRGVKELYYEEMYRADALSSLHGVSSVKVERIITSASRPPKSVST